MFGTTVPWIAYVSLVLWAFVVIAFAPSAWRYMRGPHNLIDSYRAAMFYVGLLWFGALGRLVFLPTAEGMRVVVMALSCVLAIYLMALAWQGRR